MKHKRAFYFLSVFAFVFVACGDGVKPTQCGNGILEPLEVCDTNVPVQQSCSEWDSSQNWASGVPGCAEDCSVITQGTCTLTQLKPPGPNCGNGIIDVGEVCDGVIGVPSTCSEYNDNVPWVSGTPMCSVDCQQVLPGSCKAEGTSPQGPSDDKPNNGDPNGLDSDVKTGARCNTSAEDLLEEVCEGSVAVFCDPDGYVIRRDCAKLSTPSNPLSCAVAVDGEYADCVAPCSTSSFPDNKMSCVGKYDAIHLCEAAKDGKTYEFIYTDDPCPIACSNGYCVSQPAPQEGASCDIATFAKTCFDGAAYACEGGVIRKTECPTGKTCAMTFGSSEPVCTEPCSLGSTSLFGCQTIAGKPALANRVCTLGTDSKYYWFEENTPCQQSCDQGVCDVKIPEVGSNCDSSMNDLCAQNSLYYCRTDTETIDVMTCGRGEYVGAPLCRELDEGYGDCVYPCEEGSEPLMQCSKTNQHGAYTSNYICEKAMDGSFYMFYHEETCPNGCKDGVCL